MKPRYRLVHRGSRGDRYYCVDTQTGKRTSLGTGDRDAAGRLIHAKNEAQRQPVLNLQIARAYLAGADSGMTTRTWRDALDALTSMKQGANRERWRTVAQDRALASLLPKVVSETTGEILLDALRRGTVSTNVFLRRLHNFCLDMDWLPRALIPKRQWPPVRHEPKRAITREEHQKIIGDEPNPERMAFYQLCWHLGASQGDIAGLRGEDVDWSNHTVNFARKKTGVPVHIHLGAEALAVLKALPAAGLLFPYLVRLRASDRANLFKDRCRRLAIAGVTLHSYRYAWAERAKTVGYPERFAQEALGHNSKAVHRAYARKAQVTLPSLEDYEKMAAPIIPLPVAAAG